MKTLIFDTETTGLLNNSLLGTEQQPRVIEFYGEVVEDDGTVIDSLEFRCNPGCEIPEKVTEITGIRFEDVSDEPPFGLYTDQLKRLFAAASAVAAHNLLFDIRILEYEFERMGDKIEWPKIKVCTVEETEWVKGHRLTLSLLHDHLFGEPFAGAHRAKVDVKALTRCWLRMRELDWV